MHRLLPAALALALTVPPGAAVAQGVDRTYVGRAGTCPPPLKVAAGACVSQCPAGYEDNGRVCSYRNLSR